jgi:hypothetical protein
VDDQAPEKLSTSSSRHAEPQGHSDYNSILGHSDRATRKRGQLVCLLIMAFFMFRNCAASLDPNVLAYNSFRSKWTAECAKGAAEVDAWTLEAERPNADPARLAARIRTGIIPPYERALRIIDAFDSPDLKLSRAAGKFQSINATVLDHWRRVALALEKGDSAAVEKEMDAFDAWVKAHEEGASPTSSPAPH